MWTRCLIADPYKRHWQVQTLPSVLPHTECGLFNAMFIYQPHIDSRNRTVWYGGESTQFHYELCDSNGNWHDECIRTLGGGTPTGVSELHAELVDFYNHCTDELLI